MHLLSLKEVTKRFDSKKVLNKITLDFDIGEFVVLVGKSGSGKSTLLNLLDFSLKPNGGKVLFQEKELKRKEVSFVKQKYIKRIYQNHNLISYYTIYENLLLSKIITGGEGEEIDKFLIYFNLEEIKDKYPSQISGGERQRIAIIRALLDNPLIILADEPTGSLDEDNKIKVMDLLKKNQEGKLIIMVTHNMRLAKLYADRIVEIKEDGTIKDLKTKETETQFHLEISKSFEANIKKVFQLNLKSLRKRITKMISLFSILTLMTLSLSFFVGIKNGINNYISTMVNERIDKNTFTIYYETKEGIIENEDVLKNTSFKYERSVSYSFILNNILFNDFYINDKRIEGYFEISLIHDKDLENQFYMNNLMVDNREAFNMISIDNHLLKEEFVLKEIIEESKIYNNPRIYLSYQYIKRILDSKNVVEKTNKIYPNIQYIYDYYILDEKDVYDFLSNNKRCISFYKSVLSKNKSFYVYNNSRVMVKETFQELFDNIIFIIELLGIIVMLFLCVLTYLLICYIYIARGKELGLIKDFGGGENELSKFVLSDLCIVSFFSFFVSFLLLFLIKEMIELDNIPIIEFSIQSTAIVYGIIIIVELIIIMFFLIRKRKEDLSLILKEEEE